MSADSDPQPPRPDADYHENIDITQLHAAVMREKAEPGEGNEPISLWLVAFFGITLFFGGIYLALYSGGFQLDEYSIYAGGRGPGGSTAVDSGPVELTLAQIGERVYRQNCLTCHGSNGMGQPGLYPPLVGSHWVIGSEKRLAGILLHGVAGPMTVLGNVYNGAMPAWATESDERLAAVMTYIRTAWGNDASEITPDMIASSRDIFAGRSGTWSEAELLDIPEGTPLPRAEIEDVPAAAPGSPDDSSDSPDGEDATI